MNTQSPVCPVCSSHITTLFHRRNRDEAVDSFTPSSSDFGIFFDLYRCDGCHAVFASQAPASWELSRLYAQSCHEGYMREEENRRRNFRHLARLLGAYVDNDKEIKLLDAGASTGLFLDTMRTAYPTWEYTGVEASSGAARTCRERFGIELIEGMFETAPIPAESQDIVTMLDVIEHASEPLRILNAANRALKTGGFLVLTTPNIESWTARLFGRRWWSFRLMHTLYFSPLSMRQMLARSGFRVVKMRGLIRLFSMRYCLQHLGWTIRGPRFVLPFPLALGDMLVIARKELPSFSQGNPT